MTSTSARSPIARLVAWIDRHPLWTLALVALAVRLLPVMVNFVIGTDDGLFFTLAQRLAAGGAYTVDGRVIQADFPPGFALFAAAVYRLGGGLELPAKLNLLLFGSLLPLPVYWLAQGLTPVLAPGERNRPIHATPAFRAGLLTALLPALALATANFEATAEPLYSLLLYSGWAALWWGISRSAKDRQGLWASLLPFLLAGLALGASHIVRWEGVILALLGAGAILVALRQRAVLPVVIFMAAVGVFAVPYALFLHRHTGSYVNPKTKITQLHSALLELSVSDPYAFERYYYNLEDVLADPINLSHVPPELLAHRLPLPQRYLGNLLLELRLWLTTASLLTVVWIGPAVLGALALPRWRALFLLLLFAPLGAIPASVVDPRYFLPALPAAMIFAAFGWGWLETRLRQRRLLPSLSVASALLAATLALFLVFDLAAPFWLPRPTEYRKAGLALRGQLPEGAHMLARKRQVPFYAGATWEWLPFADLDGVIAYAAERDADYFLLDRRTTVPLRPQLAELLDPANAPPGLRPIYYDEAGGVVVYYIER